MEKCKIGNTVLKQFVLSSKLVVTKHSNQVQVLLITELFDINPRRKQNSYHHREVKTGQTECAKKKKKKIIHNVISP